MRMKAGKKKSNANKRSKRKGAFKGPLPVFLLTLFLVLSAGILILLIAKTLAIAGAGEEKSAKGDALAPKEEGKGPFGENTLGEGKPWEDFLWESIPKGGDEIKETMAGAVGGPEEDLPNTRYGEVLADEAYMKENRIVPWQAKDKEEVTLGFTGDILLDDAYAVMVAFLSRGGAIEEGISGELLERMRNIDIMAINNEFPYTNRGTPTEGKAFTFRADTNMVSYLHDMGADVAVIANNHTYDFGEIGLLDTLDTLEAAGIFGIGAGRNIKEASAPLYFIVNDIKIALVAATQIERLENPDTKGATENSPGVFRCLNPGKLYETVKTAKENSDFVIVCVHWGTENQAQADWAQLDQAPGLANAGADLIIGDHPHCLQGITYYGDTPVIYSLGNFWFSSKTLDTGMVQVTVDKDGLKSLQFIPAIQSGCRVDMAHGEEKERILAYMRELSPGVVIDGDGFVGKQ